MALTDEDKRWIASQLGEFHSTLDAKIERLDVKIDSVQTALDAKIEPVETSLLTAFHKWASPNEARQRTHTANLQALDLELEALRERVEKLENQRPH